MAAQHPLGKPQQNGTASAFIDWSLILARKQQQHL
jgi:hypothetical protein